MNRPLPFWTALAILLLAPFVGLGLAYVASVVNAKGAGESPPPMVIGAAVLDDPVDSGEFALTDAQGRRFDKNALTGKWSFLLFGYTHCPDVCPFTLTNLALIRETMAADFSETELPQFVFVSVDPARDKPQDLDGYISYFDPAFRAVTGIRTEIDRLVKQVGGYYRYERKNADGEYEVTHSAEIFVFDPKGRHYATLHPPLDPTDITARFRALKAHFQSAAANS